MRLAILCTVCLLTLATGYFFYSRYGKHAGARGPASAAEVDAAGNWQSERDSCGSQECRFKVAITTKGVCHAGDLDFIKFDLMKVSHERQVLFSIEPIVMDKKSDVHPWFTQMISLEQLQSGMSFDVSF